MGALGAAALPDLSSWSLDDEVFSSRGEPLHLTRICKRMRMRAPAPYAVYSSRHQSVLTSNRKKPLLTHGSRESVGNE
jgi:hypothetical protein